MDKDYLKIRLRNQRFDSFEDTRKSSNFIAKKNLAELVIISSFNKKSWNRKKCTKISNQNTAEPKNIHDCVQFSNINQ